MGVGSARVMSNCRYGYDIIGMTIEFDHAMEHADIASLKEQGYVVDKVWVHDGYLYVDIVEIGR